MTSAKIQRKIEGSQKVFVCQKSFKKREKYRMTSRNSFRMSSSPMNGDIMKKNDRYFYPAVFTYEPGCEIAVTFPDLDVATSGVNEDDALLSARELLGCVLFGLEEDGEEIPQPTSLIDVPVEPNEQVVLIDAFLSSARLAQSN